MKRTLIYITSICLISACGSHEEKHDGPTTSHKGLVQSLPDQVADTVVYDEEMSTLMDDLKKVLVNLPQNEHLQNAPKPPQKKTYVLTRKQHLESFPCSNCHGEVLKKSKDSTKNAHWNIQLNHANMETMNCNSCHNLKKPDVLTSLTGSAIDFDHSYQVCAQCHSNQGKDWLGGAHGKRIRGWIKPRTINNCVSCHNPHQPQIKSRWPARLNTAKLLERND